MVLRLRSMLGDARGIPLNVAAHLVALAILVSLLGAAFLVSVLVMETIDAIKQGIHNRREERKWKHYCETGEMR